MKSKLRKRMGRSNFEGNYACFVLVSSDLRIQFPLDVRRTEWGIYLHFSFFPRERRFGFPVHDIIAVDEWGVFFWISIAFKKGLRFDSLWPIVLF